jgi:hypothetical protein
VLGETAVTIANPATTSALPLQLVAGSEQKPRTAARARSQATSLSTRCGCCQPRQAAPDEARSPGGRSARPPSPAPPAPWSAATEGPQARRSPPRSSLRRAARQRARPATSHADHRATAQRIPARGAGSPDGSPAPPRSEPLARTTESTSRVIGMTLLSSDAYTRRSDTPIDSSAQQCRDEQSSRQRRYSDAPGGIQTRLHLSGAVAARGVADVKSWLPPPSSGSQVMTATAARGRALHMTEPTTAWRHPLRRGLLRCARGATMVAPVRQGGVVFY